MKRRVLTALILIPLVLVVMMSASPWPLFGLCALVTGVGFAELALFGGSTRPPFPFFPVLLFAGFFLYGLYAPGWIPIAALVGLSIFGVLLAPLWVDRPSALLFQTASCWIACPLLALCILQFELSTPGRWFVPSTPLFLVVLPLWVGDSLAYFGGKKFGKHPLAPSISPKKTVEGGVANLVGCLVTGLVVAYCIAVPLWVGLVCGALSGVLGQAGDLFESSLKRAAGVKDAGGLLPGHGGILDRIDSLLFAAPLEALLLASIWPQHLSR